MATPAVSEGRSEPATSKTESKPETSEGAGSTKTAGKGDRLNDICSCFYLVPSNVKISLPPGSEAQLQSQVHARRSHEGGELREVQSGRTVAG